MFIGQYLWEPMWYWLVLMLVALVAAAADAGWFPGVAL